MKKIMTLVAAIVMIATANASNNNNGNSETEPLKLAPFTEVKVNVPSRVKLVIGEDYGVMTSSTNLLDNTQLDYKVKDGVLYISTESLDMLQASGRGTIITVITPNDKTNIKVGNNMQFVRRK